MLHDRHSQIVPCCVRPVLGVASCYTVGVMLNAARTATLTRELAVLDAQRRALVAALHKLSPRRVYPGSVTGRAIAYLSRFPGPATTTEILDFIIAERPQLNRRACAVTLYRAGRRKQIVREGPGWVLPEAAAVRAFDHQ